MCSSTRLVIKKPQRNTGVPLEEFKHVVDEVRNLFLVAALVETVDNDNEWFSNEIETHIIPLDGFDWVVNEALELSGEGGGLGKKACMCLQGSFDVRGSRRYHGCNLAGNSGCEP